MIVYIKDGQVFYTPWEGAQEVFLSDDVRPTAVELDPRNNEYNGLTLEQVKKLQKLSKNL